MLFQKLLFLPLAFLFSYIPMPCETPSATVTCEVQDVSAAVGAALQSSLKVYSTFVTSTVSFKPDFCAHSSKNYTLMCAQGSAIVYRIEGDDTYILTNYHVVFNSGADETANGGKTAREIYCYLYGSEDAPKMTGEKDKTYGFPLCDFGEYGIRCEYAGGSVSADLALLKAKTSDITAVNEKIREATLADGYTAGETAIAIGNTEGEGISVTRGIVSVENEWIPLKIDGAERKYRCLRIDTPIYNGNSGGGLFNTEGKLIGITNAGSTEKQNINYAIPISIVHGMAENLLHHYLDGNPDTFGAYKIALGCTVSGEHSKYLYDDQSGTGKIVEETRIDRIEDQSIAKTLGLAEGDMITHLIVNGAAHRVERAFDISDLLLTVRAGDTLSVTYLRGGEKADSAEYTVSASDLNPIA